MVGNIGDITTARERFLASGVVPDVPLRAGIAESWLRSSYAGVDCDGLDPPYFDDVDTDGRLVEAARPVLDRLEETLGESAAASVFLTDALGRVLDRRVTDRALARHLDHIRLAPGFSFAEEHVGTNGIGTGLETRRLAHVAGGEHFAGPLHETACAGAPIRDPLTGRMAGLVDLTCWNRDAGPLMAALMGHAAADIERRLLEIGSTRERAMLAEFLAANRRGDRAILTLGEDLTLANDRAAGLLAPADHAIVRDRVTDMLRSGRDAVCELVLSRGEAATLRCRPVASPGGAAGAMVEIDMGRRPAPRRLVRPADLNLAGSSMIFSRVCTELLALCRARTWVLVEGEPGVGKLAIAEAVHRRCAPGSAFTVVDGEEDVSRMTPEGTVVLRHPERFAAGTLASVLDRVDAARVRWLVATASAEVPEELLRRLPVTVTVPPLRHRIDDLRELVPALLGRFAMGRSVSCGPAALRVLGRSRWPGNVAELAQALRHALSRRRHGEIQPADLPESCHATARNILSPWEAIERDAIVRTLRETDGDKAAAAELLGISRATIYRRISRYGITVD